MHIYSGYILFRKDTITSIASRVATSKLYKLADDFLDAMELDARRNELFSVSDVCLHCLEVEFLETGGLEKVKETDRRFNNYRG